MALAEIVAAKRAAVSERQQRRPLDGFAAEIAPSDRSLRRALGQPRTALVLECKRASPSRGIIRADFDPAAIATSYAPICDAISVLTDEPFFGGRLEDLRAVRQAVAVPVLCKDFVVDPYQIHEARWYGADAILLLVAVLTPAELDACLGVCRRLDVDALVEVHDEAELAVALAVGATIIGINNRDLRTLSVDLGTAARLAPRVPPDRLMVCESGIESHHDLRRLGPLFDAFLVGTALMRRSDLDRAVRELCCGRSKVCGLTRREDAEHAWRAGATLGGVVLWPGSPRALTVAEAAGLCPEVPLGWVGVFVDEQPERVAAAATRLDLAAVQLHGHESTAYATALRRLLPPGCELWHAHRIGAPDRPLPSTASSWGADRLLFDAYRPGVPGGTGARCDWAVVAEHAERAESLLSGGLDPDCAAAADALGCWALDVSSGLERAPGVKDPARIEAFFAALRGPGRQRA